MRKLIEFFSTIGVGIPVITSILGSFYGVVLVVKYIWDFKDLGDALIATLMSSAIIGAVFVFCYLAGEAVLCYIHNDEEEKEEQNETDNN